MNRRLFIQSAAATGSSLILRRSALGRGLSPAIQSARVSEQSEIVRAAGARFLRTLASERQARVVFPFPAHETPTLAKFARQGGPSGPGPGGAGGPGGGGRGGPGGPGGPAGFAFVGEKYGQSMWTNFPVSDVPRPGLRMGELTVAEREAVHGLLKAVLSPMGYQKVFDIMAADQEYPMRAQITRPATTPTR